MNTSFKISYEQSYTKLQNFHAVKFLMPPTFNKHNNFYLKSQTLTILISLCLQTLFFFQFQYSTLFLRLMYQILFASKQ